MTFPTKGRRRDSDAGTLKREQGPPILGWGWFVKRLGTTSERCLVGSQEGGPYSQGRLNCGLHARAHTPQSKR